MSDSSKFDVISDIGLRPDGLPDITWCEDVLPGTYKIGSSEFLETLEEQNFVLQHPFRLARYPTTRIQFITFIRDTSVYKKTLESTIGPGHPHAPCPCIYWSDPFRFARWLDQKYREVGLLDEGWMIDVPSEIEWEIAARCPPAEDFESLSHPEQKLGDVNIVPM
jgi:formylglycine-generating enzyme required for sulfatase activity